MNSFSSGSGGLEASYNKPQRRAKYITKAHEVFDYQIIAFVRLRETLCATSW
jgi:hypothetical protein